MDRCASATIIVDDFKGGSLAVRCEKEDGHSGPHAEYWTTPSDIGVLVVWAAEVPDLDEVRELLGVK